MHACAAVSATKVVVVLLLFFSACESIFLSVGATHQPLARSAQGGGRVDTTYYCCSGLRCHHEDQCRQRVRALINSFIIVGRCIIIYCYLFVFVNCYCPRLRIKASSCAK